MGNSVDSRELAPVHGLMNGVGMMGAVSPVGMGVTSLPPMGHMGAHMQLGRGGWNTQQQNMASRALMGAKPVAPFLPRPAITHATADYPSTVTNGHHTYARSINSMGSPTSRPRVAGAVPTLSSFFDAALSVDDNRPSTNGSHRSQAYRTPADAGWVSHEEARYIFDQ